MTKKHVLHPALGLPALLVLILLIYLPVRHAGFVWDDITVFQQSGWLYQGEQWKKYLFSGFNGWEFYFRPLVVALFVLQARLFEGLPGPMHLVSLGMQLANVTLVVLLARRLALIQNQRSRLLPLFAGAFFGMHPMLVETVVWIGCQFDQMQVFFALLGLMASLGIEQRWPRAAMVSICFFLSACSKESAALYPFIVMVFDWLVRSNRETPMHKRLQMLWHANWPVYLLLLLAGLAYIMLRHWAMGAVLGDTQPEDFIPSLARIDEISHIYLKYWMVIAGIPLELSPIHPVDAVVFGQDLAALALRVGSAVLLLSIGLLVPTRRFAFTGAAVLVTGAYLFPVLGFFPGHFDGSLYHERYAIGAIAMTAVLLPGIVGEWRPVLQNALLLRKLLLLLALGWLGWAALNVRVTIPLWSSDLALWRWAHEMHPNSAMVRGNLLSNLTHPAHVLEIRGLIEDALQHNLDCDMCYLNGFSFAINHGDRVMIERLQDKINELAGRKDERILSYLYFLTGFLELRKGDAEAAESWLRRSMEVEFDLTYTYVVLAEALIAQGRSDKAEAAAGKAVEYAYPPDAPRFQDITSRILQGEIIFGAPLEAGSVNLQGNRPHDSGEGD